MKNGIKYIYDANPFYVFLKKHYCPHCEKKMKIKYHKKLVNSKSIEASKYDFSSGDTFLVGNVELRIAYLHCPFCNLQVSMKQMKEYEKKGIK